MPAWNELLQQFAAAGSLQQQGTWVTAQLQKALAAIAAKRGSNVIVYASGFLQKPAVPPIFLQINHDDVNGLMSVMYGMDWAKPLTLILHTPGGVTNAVETIGEYLLSKFTRIDVIVPTMAMSAGTMLSLAADEIIMGRPSQLGPIDPQMPIGQRSVSARAIVDQFETARTEILADQRAAHLWAPVLQALGPALLQEAKNALDYSEKMVARWMEKRVFAGRSDAVQLAAKTASYFNASQHKSHGQRIDRDEARTQSLNVTDLEGDQQLQELVLTAYHLCTILFETGPLVKVMADDRGRQWAKTFMPPANPAPPPTFGAPAIPTPLPARPAAPPAAGAPASAPGASA
jgi:ClpP class serine protease